MNAPALPRRHPYLFQVIATAVVAAAFVLATDAVGYRGMANAIGIFLPPIAIAVLLNRSWDRRVFMIMGLAGVSLLTSIVVGVNFTSYG
ncbi:hypothetical protein [Sphingomonas sp. STIS6.2]|uniref:hypothetical protein n=1 Tax=Sphingomonas sp. STIS6.2 TaxID=1379700 RepID=UPI00131C6E4E|nr:hypothetical protein [Sphingomonas sp. STIS6.2]